MPEIRDLRVVLDCEGWGPKTIQARLSDMLDQTREEMVGLADARLGATAFKYKASIGQPQVQIFGPGLIRGTLSLGGEGVDAGDAALAGMLEEGHAPYDLRPGLLPGRDGKAKRSADGHMYRSIPFQHSAGKGGRGRPAMGSQLTRHGLRPEQTAFRGNLKEAAARQLGTFIRGEAKMLAPTRTSPDENTKTKWGGRLDAGLAQILRPRHVTDIFAGMVRAEKVYERATQEQFMTFRTISDNPGTHRYDTKTQRPGMHPAGAVNVMGNTMERNWMHPGFAPRRIFQDGAEYLASILNAGDAFGELPTVEKPDG